MTALAAFHFLRPGLLWLLLPLLILAWLVWRRKRSQGAWVQVCDEALLPYLLQQPPGQQSFSLLATMVLAGVLAVFALAGPAWQRLPAPVFRNVAALVIVLDLSRSMDAADIKPSRLARARYKIADLLGQRKDGQAALVAYAGAAFTVTPLTDDVQTIANQLPALTTAIMPSQGSQTAAALQKAATLLTQAGLQSGEIVLVTDGVDLTQTLLAVEQLQGFHLSVLGVGTPEGAPIPGEDGGFVKDAQGSIVIPKLDDVPLAQLAQAGGGVYQPMTEDGQDIQVLTQTFERALPQAQEEGKQTKLVLWRDQGPWLLLAVIPLMALGFRKGLLMWWLVLLLPMPQNSYADAWQNLWQTPDQQGQQKFRAQQYAEAAAQFVDSQWKAAAHYQAGEYDQAVAALRAQPKPDSSDYFYNLGNALAQSGQLQEALKAYDQALAIKPGHEDAQYNKALVAKEWAKQQPPQPPAPQQPPSQSDTKDGQQQPGTEPQDSQKTGEAGQQERSSDDGLGHESQSGQNAGTTPPPKSSPANEASAQPGNQVAQPGVTPTPADKPQKNQSGSEAVKAGVTTQEKMAEAQRQAEKLWLERIPDDPSGLLRRKFRLQYKRQAGAAESDSGW